jgi:hypothetical protein
MVYQVSGYKTVDGRFFESKEEADYEETKLLITTEAESAIQITRVNLIAFLDFIEDNASLIKEHCDAYLAFKNKDKYVNHVVVETVDKENSLQTIVTDEAKNVTDKE